MATQKRTRMYEPWGYREENNYQGNEIIIENDLASFFADVEYKRSDNKIHFSNKDGREVGTLNVDDFVKSDQIVEKAWYEDGKIYIKFTNGDLITIDVKELIDENEFTDGLQVIDGVVSVLKDPTSEKWLTVSENGVKVDGIQAEIDRLDGRIDDEIARATSEEQRIEGKLDNEITRSTNEDARIDGKLDVEIARAKEAEAGLSRRIDTLNDELDGEKTIREAADVALGGRIDAEVTTRENNAVASAEYVESAKTIDFKNANGGVISQIDATPFLKDGMIDDVRIENGKLIIVFNTESGKETIEIPLTDIFNPDNYYTKAEVDDKVATIGENISDEVSARESGDTALDGKIDALEAVVDTKANKTEIPTDFYTQEEVDALLAEKQTEIDKIISDYKKLKEIVGDLGGDVEYSVPADGKLTDMLKKSGIIKLTEDVESNTYAGGITSKNITTLSLNGKTITTTANTTTNPSIMVRGTQQFTIQGSGTLNANGHIAIEANGGNAVITLGGTAFGRPTYVTNRSGGELIYCYEGTINITNGVFRNEGEDKSFTLNCYDANYRAGTAKIIVTGGKFYDFDPGNNTAEGPGTSFLAEGYHTEASTVVEEGVEHTVYTVKAD